MSFFTFLKDLGTIRKALMFSCILFVAGIIMGWIGTTSLEKLLLQQLEGLSEISNNLKESSHPMWSFFVFIFLNNSIKAVLMIFLGALFGIIPAIFLLINGAVIGYLVHISSIHGQNVFNLIVKGLLPHGIIEIPAIIIACAFGLHLGGKVASRIFRPSREDMRGAEWPVFMRQTLTASIWIVILLFIAAIIESTITFSLLS